MVRNFVYAWKAEEEKKLEKIMKEGEGRIDVMELFESAAAELGRTKHAVRNRWYIIRNRPKAAEKN
jgi:hypothetical protein